MGSGCAPRRKGRRPWRAFGYQSEQRPGSSGSEPRGSVADRAGAFPDFAGAQSGLRLPSRDGLLRGGQVVRFLRRLLQRLLIFGLGVFSVWLIVFVVFEFVDRRLPWMLALSVTYAIGAYVILPRAVRMGLKILKRKHVPSFTITGDGLPGDPVNLALVGTLRQLRAAFAAAGWTGADRLGLASSWRMVRAFVLNTPYPTAPFSTLYLFGRGQDIGFQKAIDNSPRKRHHIRFWALSLARAETRGDSRASGSTPTGHRTMSVFSGWAPAPGIPDSP